MVTDWRRSTHTGVLVRGHILLAHGVGVQQVFIGVSVCFTAALHWVSPDFLLNFSGF